MDYKQKLRYTVFGAMIMLVGLVIGGPSGCELLEKSDTELERSFPLRVDINGEPVLGMMSILYLPNGAMLGNEKVGCYFFKIEMIGEKPKNYVNLRLRFYDQKGFSLFHSVGDSDRFATNMNFCPSGMECLIKERRWNSRVVIIDDEYDSWGWTGRFDESCITFEAFRRIARVER